MCIFLYQRKSIKFDLSTTGYTKTINNSSINSIIGVNSAKILSLQVPVAVKIGQEFQIECHYNLKENEQLYTLKW